MSRLKMVTLGEFLTGDQIADCLRLHPDHKAIVTEVIAPNMVEINRKLGQENDPDYLAYMVLRVINEASGLWKAGPGKLDLTEGVPEHMNNQKEERFFRIRGSEDGDVRVSAYTREEFETTINREADGVDGYLENFASVIPDADPNYWHGKSIIIRGEIVVPKAMEVKTKLVLP
jgi:hypothetical protein